MSSYYQHHVFFCLNQREAGENCCANFNAKAMQEYAKKRCKELGIAGGEGRVRINKAGCLNRCELGPVLVVYPRQFGTPLWTSTTSMKSSTATCSTASRSSG